MSCLQLTRIMTLLVLCTAGHAGAAESTEAVRLAVASSLRQAWPAIEKVCRQEGAPPGVPSFAASGLLANQISLGAPFDLLLAADRLSVEHAIDSGRLAAPARPYASGYPVVVTPADSTAILDSGELDIGSLIDSLAANRDLRLALPNSAHAPYGAAAERLLDTIGGSALPRSQRAIGENAAQTLQFVLSGAALVGIIPNALAITREELTIWRPPVNERIPVVHYLAVSNTADSRAQAWADCLLSQEIRATLLDNGLNAPDDGR